MEGRRTVIMEGRKFITEGRKEVYLLLLLLPSVLYSFRSFQRKEERKIGRKDEREEGKRGVKEGRMDGRKELRT